MPYLLKNDLNQLVLIDYTSRSGLYIKIYSNNSSSRTNILYQNSTQHFTATQDTNNIIHIVCKNKKNQIIHLYQKNNHFSQEILLDDTTDNYKISNFKLVNCTDKLYLFYTALNPTEKTSDIIQHIINKGNNPPQSILSTITLNSSYTCYEYNGYLYVLSINNENKKYQLQLTRYTPEKKEWTYMDTLFSSSNPITYCNMCVDSKGIFHIVFIQNQYGQYIINYLKTNNHTNNTIQLHSCPFIIEPVIFNYNDILWVNWKENNTLLMLISTDYGDTFSDPQPCSIQDAKTIQYYYINNKSNKKNLYGNQFYGLTNTYPKLAILSQIDMDNILFDTEPKNELKLYIESIKNAYATHHYQNYENFLKENEELKQTQQHIASQYEELSKLVKKLQIEGKKWKNKYYDKEMELKTYKTQSKESMKPL